MGASSTVYEATFLPLGAVVAVKVIDCDRLSTNAIDRVRREIQLMSLSKHTNVLRVRGTWLDGPKLYIAERFMASGSMHDIVRAARAQLHGFSCNRWGHGIRLSCMPELTAAQLQYAYSDGFDEAICAAVLCVKLESGQADDAKRAGYRGPRVHAR